MKFLIVTGLSGAGKTSVLRHLEDSGYQCMDNIPPLLLAPAFTLCEKVELDTPVALGVDSRSGALFDADAVCSAIDQGGDSHEISILFLEADTETLIDRYKETRRDHPLMRGGMTLEQAIAKEREMLQPLRERANYVLSTGGLRAKELCAMRGSEERRPKMKRKFSAALAFALVGVLVVAVALAVANRKGVLDFLSYSEATLPENAGDYVQTDIASDERDGLHAAVREVVYDGHRLWATVDINMDGEKPLLTGLDYGLDEEKWAWLRHDESETDDRSILEVYREEGYTDACYIAASIYDEDDEENTSCEAHLQDDGTLTFYESLVFEQEKAEREITVSVRAFKYYEEKDGRMNVNQKPMAELKFRFTAKASAVDEETLVSVEPVEYESIGVRVDRVTVTTKPLEMDYAIEYTVVDAEKFAQTDDGLWFEFIDPNSREEQPYDQRLKEGFSVVGSVEPVDDTHFRQIGTLSLSEKADRYTLRAYECWEKRRFDTHEIRMKKVE